MINRSIHGSSPDDEYLDPTQSDLDTPPEGMEAENPYMASSAMLGPQGDPAEEAMMPSEAGPTGESLAGLGMMIQGAQLLSAHIPGFVPVEITAWLQQSMQMLPQLLQQMQSSMSSGMAGAGMGMGQTAALGPMAGAPTSQPVGPPQQY